MKDRLQAIFSKETFNGRSDNANDNLSRSYAAFALAFMSFGISGTVHRLLSIPTESFVYLSTTIPVALLSFEGVRQYILFKIKDSLIKRRIDPGEKNVSNL